ncbi:g10612 [Coccomyxa elongata]
MNGAHRPRRASPPRPSLLVGDMEACRAAFVRLQTTCAALLEQHAGHTEWEDTVPRFRSLRESLLSHQVVDEFTVAALEASSDACLRACNFAEFLKSAQHLVLTAYPLLAAQCQVSSSSMPAAEWSAAVRPPIRVANQLQSLSLANAAPRNSDGASERVPPDEHLNGGSSAAVLARWPEFAGAFLLYFVCIPPTPQSMDVASVLRRLPHSLQRCPEVAYALSIHLAVRTRDFAAFLRCYTRGSWVQRALMQPKLQQMREGAMEVFSCAYRSLSCAAARQLLLLPAGAPAPERDLAALLKACADRGSGCAARALSSLQTAEPSAPQMLVFRS